MVAGIDFHWVEFFEGDRPLENLTVRHYELTNEGSDVNFKEGGFVHLFD